MKYSAMYKASSTGGSNSIPYIFGTRLCSPSSEALDFEVGSRGADTGPIHKEPQELTEMVSAQSCPKKSFTLVFSVKMKN